MRLILLSIIIISNSYCVGQVWQNFIPNYSFEKVSDSYPSPSETGFNKSDDSVEQDFDSTKHERVRKKYHGISVELLGPVFLSSIGYNFENQIKEKLILQFDFRIAGHTGYLSSGWAIGPSLNQSAILFGKNPKLKLGLTQGIVFNIPSINGRFDEWQPWDRPEKTMYYFSTNIGCEIRIFRNIFYLTPEINLFNVNRMKYDINSNLDEIKVTRSDFFISFGIDFKFRL